MDAGPGDAREKGSQKHKGQRSPLTFSESKVRGLIQSLGIRVPFSQQDLEAMTTGHWLVPTKAMMDLWVRRGLPLSSKEGKRGCSCWTKVITAQRS